jgi:hypothetical protein
MDMAYERGPWPLGECPFTRGVYGRTFALCPPELDLVVLERDFMN